ncbi:MAG: metal ABC transporter solute-binding protein, Zn/Mn family [Salinivirgaceae bacterium]|jgi:zinc transport system substrate-binding protein|nr:zinc ABC transporter solute-binding protein [Bacteroidales bacterium]
MKALNSREKYDFMRNFAIALSLMLLASCNNNQKTDKPIVTVSLLAQKYWVERLALGFVEVNPMLVAGSDHSTYEPAPEQMRKISKSDIYFKIGHIDFEYAWIPKFINSNPKMRVVDLSEKLNLTLADSFCCKHSLNNENHGHKHTSRIDPHIWLNPPMVKEMVMIMADELCKLVPASADSIRKNEELFLKEIDSLDNYITKKLSGFQNRKFLLFHPALTWYAQQYNLQQIVIEIDGKEPSPSKMKDIIDEIKKENIKVILIQNEFPFERASVIAKETNAEIAQIKPLDYDWLSIMYEITNIIEKALRKSE